MIYGGVAQSRAELEGGRIQAAVRHLAYGGKEREGGGQTDRQTLAG